MSCVDDESKNQSKPDDARASDRANQNARTTTMSHNALVLIGVSVTPLSNRRMQLTLDPAPTFAGAKAASASSAADPGSYPLVGDQRVLDL